MGRRFQDQDDSYDPDTAKPLAAEVVLAGTSRAIQSVR
jgi:hypothetical protein